MPKLQLESLSKIITMSFEVASEDKCVCGWALLGGILVTTSLVAVAITIYVIYH